MKRSWLVEQIVSDLREEQKAMPKLDHDDLEFEDYVDVRLQMNPTEHGIYWHLHYGDASYDTDHTGFWGADCITPTSDLATLADELIGQCEEHAAQVDEKLVFDAE